MSRLNILIVEDDPINILVAEKLLEKNFNIHTAKSALDAIDSVTKKYFDVILMDINLGDEQLDGIDVMKKIRNELNINSCKIYAVTSYALFDDRERFLKEGFDAYFSKPINKELIIKTIQEDYTMV
jgi:two-component system cell cycle response regulator DivK